MSISISTRCLPHWIAAIALAGLPLAACSSDEDTPQVTESGVSGETLAAALAGAGNLDAVSAALRDTGLAQVFDGTASYTILAPDDASLLALEDSAELTDSDRRALLAAILREHVMPGALTPEDIANAIDLTGGAVEIATMGDSPLSFSIEGDAIRVSDANGGSALIAGDAIRASNGVAIPIDAVLKQP